MKAAGLRDLTYEELTERLDETKQDLFNLRFQLATSQSDNTARSGQLRREIARIKTVLGEWDREGRPRGYEDYEDYEDEPHQPVEPAVADAPVAVADAPVAVAEAQPADEEEASEEEPVAPDEPAAGEQDEPVAEEREAPEEREDEEAPKRGRRWSRWSKK